MQTSDKAYKTSCSFPPEQAAWIQAQLVARGETGTSALLQGLVQAAIDNTLPEISDGSILEQLIRLVRPERADRFARLWRAQFEALDEKRQELGYTQAEAAGALMDAFLDGVETGAIRPVENRAFAVLPAAPWLELLGAAKHDDLSTIKSLLRRFDGSGLAASYGFADYPYPLAAESATPATAEEIEAARAESARRKAKPKTPRR